MAEEKAPVRHQLCFDGIEEYAQRLSSSPSEELSAIERSTQDSCEEHIMLVGPLEGQMLKMLARMVSARRVLEIGSYTGYSAVAFAEALPEDGVVVTLDNFSDEPTSRRLLLSHLASSAQRDKIRLVEGDALESLRSLESSGEAPFDLVFIDADKEGQIAYYDLLMESPLLGDGATILVDNTLWFGKVAVPEEQMDSTTAAIHQFNKHVHDDRRSDVVVLPVRDGITVIRKAGR